VSSSNAESPEGVANVAEGSISGQRLDLRGIKCPLNWAHAKVRLEGMRRGEELELMIDDPRGMRNIPRAAEAEGYSIIEVCEAASCWRIRIER
jgi:tRNA 2-thiouridine synthesizing protein A